MEFENVHMYLSSIAGSTDTWSTFDITTSQGRAKAAEWFLDQISEVQALECAIEMYERWQAEAITAIERRYGDAFDGGERPDLHLVTLEGTPEYNRNFRRKL